MSQLLDCNRGGYGLSAADVAAVVGNQNNGNGNNCGNGMDMFGGNWAWWLIILFLFIFNGNWGRNNNGNNDGGGTNSMIPWLLANSGCNCGGGAGSVPTYYGYGEVQRGFDQQAVISGITGVQNAVNTGFSNSEVSRCNQQANILQTLNNNQNATTAALNAINMQQQNCCCETREAIADLKYTVGNEACLNRQTFTNGIQQVLTSNDVNTRTITDAVRTGFQGVQDKLCQLELNAKDDRIAALTAENTGLKFSASQTAQTAQILAGQQAQAIAVENNVNPRAVPAYIVQNPNGCGCNQGYYPYAYNNVGCCG